MFRSVDRAIVTSAMSDNKMTQTPLPLQNSAAQNAYLKYLHDLKEARQKFFGAKNVHGETPQHLASKNGFNLLNPGANIAARTNNMSSLLHTAGANALQMGANYNAKDKVFNSLNGLPPSNYVSNGMQLNPLLSQNNNGRIITSASDQTSTECKNVEKPMNYEEKMAELEYELSKIVGLKELKLQLRQWAKGMLMDEKRRATGKNLSRRKPPHMAFLGNPGTGKTSVARIFGKLLKSVGVLSSDRVTEVQRSDLVGQYIGHTAIKTKKKIQEAMGGVLFVDEAYRLAPLSSITTRIDFGLEALEEIMSVMEDGDLVVIFAGYTEPMKRVFSSNEGFCRRVTHFFQFDDFTCKDLAEMLMLKMTKQDEKSQLNGFKLHPLCTSEAVHKVIEKNSTGKLRKKMNGGLVDHMLNNARENLDSRLTFESSGDELWTLTLHDLEAGLKRLAKRPNTD